MGSLAQPIRPSISIHALREEGDVGVILSNLPIIISIHALREEGDKVRRTQRHF